MMFQNNLSTIFFSSQKISLKNKVFDFLTGSLKKMLIYVVIHTCLERCLVKDKIIRNFSALKPLTRTLE